MKDYQMLIDHFNPDIPPRCNKHYPLNGFFKNCFFCPYTLRNNGTVSCRLSGKKITTREKYALTAWKKLREKVLTRDNQTCVICGTREHLHIHHMDSDNTRDDPEISSPFATTVMPVPTVN